MAGTIHLPLYRGIMIACAPLILYSVIKGRYPRVNACDALFVIHVLWVILSIFFHDPSFEAFEPSGAYAVESLIPYMAARIYLSDANTVSHFYSALSMVILALAPVAFAGSVLHMDPIDSWLRPALGYPLQSFDERMGLSRVSMTFFHPIQWGVFASVIFSFAIASTNYLKKFPWILASALGVISSGSSGAMMSLTVQSLLSIWGWLLRGIRVRWVLLLLGFACFYIFLALVSNRPPMKAFLSYATLSPGTAFNRLLIWEYGSAEVMRYPIFGIGLYRDWTRPAWMVASVDNFWLLIAMRHGMIASLSLLAIVLLQVAQWAHRSTIIENRKHNYHFYALIAISLAAVTVHIWQSSFIFYCLLLGLGPGLLEALKKPEEDDVYLSHDETVGISDVMLNEDVRGA
jgi:hypothetical protein